MKLILASHSAARRAMLEAAGVPFETAMVGLDEAAAKAGLVGAGFAPRDLAEELGRLKALSVDAGVKALVLGADQVLEREDGSTLSKPESREEAFSQLRSLSGTSHRLHSAAVIAEAGQSVWAEQQSVTLTMRRLTDSFLGSYLEREYEAIRWGVGGYRIEGEGAQLFERIEGSHFAILGLPLLPLLSYLRQREILPS